MSDYERATAVELRFLTSRKLKDPFDKPITTYEFRVDTRTIPELPNEANARADDAGINRRVYRLVKDSALDGGLELDGQDVTPGMFGYKHLGINLIADRVEEVGERTARLHFREGQGVVNGGHGLRILRDLQADPKYGQKMPQNFIKVTVITGIDRFVIPEISGANNSSVQVKAHSLLELEGAFEPLKQALKGTRLDGNVQWREGDDGDVKVEDIVAAMTCFRIDAYPLGKRHSKLINSYAYKTGLLTVYRSEMERYHQLARLLPEILEFQDYIRTQPRRTYNNEGKRFGALKFVDSIHTDAKGSKRELPYFVMPFTGESEVEFRLNVAAVYPILAAFRTFVEYDEGEFRWTKPFSEIKAFWDNISVDVVETTRESCKNEGYNLNALGKSRPHWAEVERIVENATLKLQIEHLMSER
jgi:hypothetical protein